MELGFGTIDLEPGTTGPHRGISLFVAAAAVPFATAAALIPLRGELAHSAGIILVVPVIIFGVGFGALAGSIAATSAAIGFDLFLLAPYLNPQIKSPEDVVANVTLLCVGIIVGAIGSRLARMNRRSAERLRELTVLEAHSEMITRLGEGTSPSEAVEITGAHLTELLRLRACRWEPMSEWNPTSTVGQPTMLPNGQIIGRLADLPEDRALLPNPVELVLSVDEHPFGRFVLVPDGTRTSIEERRIAATLCRLTAAYLKSQESNDRNR